MELPPPIATSGGIRELIEVLPVAAVPKIPAKSVWSADRLLAWFNWLIKLGGIAINLCLVGGSMPSFVAVLRSTSSSSISSSNSPRALSICWMSSPARASRCGVSRMVRL